MKLMRDQMRKLPGHPAPRVVFACLGFWLGAASVLPAAQAQKSAAAKPPAVGAGQPAGAAAQQGGDTKPTGVKIERGAGGKKVYVITDVVTIEGKIQKPEAFYVLQKSGINYDWQDLKQDFIPKIMDSVTRSPF